MFQSDQGPAERIEQLEIRIEELRDSIRRSRRLILAGRACAVIGPALLVCVMLGLINFTPVRMIVGLALAIGGVVLTGSSRASTQQLEFLLRQTEKERSAAIDALDLIQAAGSVDDPGI
jgi:O-antigen ligase